MNACGYLSYRLDQLVERHTNVREISRVRTPDQTNTHDIKITGKNCCSHDICKLLDVLVFLDQDDKPLCPVSCIFNITVSRDDKKSTHLLQRGGHEPPSVVLGTKLPVLDDIGNSRKC